MLSYKSCCSTIGTLSFSKINLARSNNLVDKSFVAVSESRYVGTLGASILKVGSLAVGSVGWTEKRLKAAAIPFRKIYLNPSSNAGFYPGGTPIFVKLLFAPSDGKILGAQVGQVEGVGSLVFPMGRNVRSGEGGNFFLKKFPSFPRSFAPSQGLSFNQNILYFNLKLSAIIAINSLFVGLPRLFWMV